MDQLLKIAVIFSGKFQIQNQNVSVSSRTSTGADVDRVGDLDV